MVKIKVCGLTSKNDAEMVSDAGADFAGVISQVDVSTPREVDIGKAKEIIGTFPEDVQTVLVTMVEEVERIRDFERKLDPDYIQIHSELSNSQLRNLNGNIETGLIGIVSIPPELKYPDDIVSRAKSKSEEVDLLLLDTEVPHEGDRMTHDWNISSKIRDSVEVPVILAGGLTPNNVARAIGQVDPYAVDVASGVESNPGRKSSVLVEDFIEGAGG